MNDHPSELAGTGQRKTWLTGLHELRALGALAVVWHHIELIKARDGLPSLMDTAAAGTMQLLGKNGVSLFFVLSGFLITYLLFVEREKKGEVDIKAFYVRRTLRIWPLYYTIVAVGFVLMPLLAPLPMFQSQTYAHLATNVWAEGPWNLVLFLCLLPHVALESGYKVAGASQAWSIGLEEQFYLLWPWVFVWLRSSRVRWIVAGMGCLALAIGPKVLPVLGFPGVGLIAQAAALFGAKYMYLMGVGCGGAYAYWFHHEGVVSWFDRRWVSWVSALAGLGYVVAGHAAPAAVRVLLSGPIAMVVIFAALRHVNKMPALYRLGNISYGIYMIHPFIIFVVSGLLAAAGVEGLGVGPYNLLLYGSVIGLTILVSELSFRYLETPFLGLKARFVRV